MKKNHLILLYIVILIIVMLFEIYLLTFRLEEEKKKEVKKQISYSIEFKSVLSKKVISEEAEKLAKQKASELKKIAK